MTLNAARPSAILFVCNLNRVRSPMAAALARRRGGGAMFADSCGLEAADGVDPFVVAVMEEAGVDLADHQPKRLGDVQAGLFDMVVCLTPEAHERAVALARGQGIEVEYWPTPDPTLESGSREQRLEAYRDVRRSLERRLAETLG